MTPLERDIEKSLTRAIGRMGGICMKWVCPGWNGVPDRIVFMPGGRIYFVELKRPEGGRISKLQTEWHKRLRDLGFNTFFIHSHEGVNHFISSVVNGYTGYAFREPSPDELEGTE